MLIFPFCVSSCCEDVFVTVTNGKSGIFSWILKVMSCIHVMCMFQNLWLCQKCNSLPLIKNYINLISFQWNDIRTNKIYVFIVNERAVYIM